MLTVESDTLTTVNFSPNTNVLDISWKGPAQGITWLKFSTDAETVEDGDQTTNDNSGELSLPDNSGIYQVEIAQNDYGISGFKFYIKRQTCYLSCSEDLAETFGPINFATATIYRGGWMAQTAYGRAINPDGSPCPITILSGTVLSGPTTDLPFLIDGSTAYLKINELCIAGDYEVRLRFNTQT